MDPSKLCDEYLITWHFFLMSSFSTSLEIESVKFTIAFKVFATHDLYSIKNKSLNHSSLLSELKQFDSVHFFRFQVS
jgi:hypothetical protein